jgi:hypothetical protein
MVVELHLISHLSPLTPPSLPTPPPPPVLSHSYHRSSPIDNDDPCWEEKWEALEEEEGADIVAIPKDTLWDALQVHVTITRLLRGIHRLFSDPQRHVLTRP